MKPGSDYAQLLETVRAKCEEKKAAGGRPLRVLIDGVSGAGKTTLANRLGTDLGALVLHSDDWVPGWRGFAEASQITEQLVTGRRDCYSRFDWHQMRPAEEVCPDRGRPWVVEGGGTVTPVSAAAGDVVVWVDADRQLAKKRALRRDGTMFAPWWDTWRQQENEHFEVHDPQALADIVFTA